MPMSVLCFSYRIIGGNSQFTINPSTGQIITSALLDRETKENYTLVVVASDAGSPEPLSSSTSVLVTVTDVNDNPPRFQHHPYVTHIPSPTPPGNQTASDVSQINKNYALGTCYNYISVFSAGIFLTQPKFANPLKLNSCLKQLKEH